jgi:hypothetical protein
MAFKPFGSGNKINDDTFKNNTYIDIESYEVRDNVNKTDLTRPVRNVYENTQHLFSFLEPFAYGRIQKYGVLKNYRGGDTTKLYSFRQGDSDISSITYTNATGDTRKHYARLAPGVLYHWGKTVVVRSETHILERRLNKIFGLNDWNDEGVYINYFYSKDRYQAKVVKRNAATNNLTSYVYGGTWGDSTHANNFKNCFKMLENIWADSLWKPSLRANVGDSLISLCCEPTTYVQSWISDTYIWKVNKNGKVWGDTTQATGDSIVSISWVQSSISGTYFAQKAATNAYGDSYLHNNRGYSGLSGRLYYQNYNDYDNTIFFNVPRRFGDTGTEAFTNNIWGDSRRVPYAFVANKNAFQVTLRNIGGNRGDNAIFGWSDTLVPKINPPRAQRYWMNKDLIVWRGAGTSVTSGDTLGKRWVAINELSGDSWQFYGNKYFNDGNFRFNDHRDNHYFRINGVGDSFLFKTNPAENTNRGTVSIGDSIGNVSFKLKVSDGVNDNSGVLVRNRVTGTLASVGIAAATSTGDSIALYKYSAGFTSSAADSRLPSWGRLATTKGLAISAADTIIFYSSAANSNQRAKFYILQSVADSCLINSGRATVGLFNAVTSKLNIGCAATTINIGAAGANITTLGHGTLVGTQTTQNVFNTIATIVNFAGAATTIAIGLAAGGTTTVLSNTVSLSGATTFNAINFATLNLGTTGGTAINMGRAADGTITAYSKIFSHTGTTSFATAGSTFAHSGTGNFTTATAGTFSALDATTISFGTSAASRTINIGTAATATQTINIGSANAAVGITSPTLTLTGAITGPTSIAMNGALSGTTTIAMNGALSGTTTIAMNGALSGTTTIAMNGALSGTTSIACTSIVLSAQAATTMVYEDDCTTFAGTADGTKGTTVQGMFAAYKVYNAVWNDYAEAFDADLTEKPDAGYVYKQTKTGLRKTEKRSEKATIGVFSDTYGMLMGSKDSIVEHPTDGKSIPIGMAGKVKVWVKDKLEIGDLLVSDKNGFAVRANIIDRILRQDCIIGKVLEPNEGVNRIWMFIK